MLPSGDNKLNAVFAAELQCCRNILGTSNIDDDSLILSANWLRQIDTARACYRLLSSPMRHSIVQCLHILVVSVLSSEKVCGHKDLVRTRCLSEEVRPRHLRNDLRWNKKQAKAYFEHILRLPAHIRLSSLGISLTAQ